MSNPPLFAGIGILQGGLIGLAVAERSSPLLWLAPILGLLLIVIGVLYGRQAARRARFRPPIPWKVAVFDIETTGLDPNLHQTLSIGAALYEFYPGRGYVEVDSFEHRLPYLGGPVMQEAMDINKIDLTSWEPTADEKPALERLHGLLDQAKEIWGHGVVFDWSFLEPRMTFHGIDYIDLLRRTRDTRSLARPLVLLGFVWTHSLGPLCSYFGISNEGAHTALADARRTFRVYLALTKFYQKHIGISPEPAKKPEGKAA
jgi:DNA polymerase III epsilon subunit-like protein